MTVKTELEHYYEIESWVVWSSAPLAYYADEAYHEHVLQASVETDVVYGRKGESWPVNTLTGASTPPFYRTLAGGEAFHISMITGPTDPDKGSRLKKLRTAVLEGTARKRYLS